MLLKSIKIKNFRQLNYDYIPLTFSLDSQKNTTLVIADNAAGKTVFIQSIIWCLYGKTFFKKQAKYLLFNIESYSNHIKGSSEDLELFVELNLLHEGKDYFIRRSLKIKEGQKTPRKDTFSVKEKTESGDEIDILSEDCQDFINNILPEDLCNYFFFWAERIEDFNEGENLANDVEKYLGLASSKKELNHLKIVKENFKEDLAEGLDEKNQELKERSYNLWNQIKEDEERLNNIKSEIDEYDKLIKQEEKKLEDNKESKRIQEKIANLENSLKESKNNLNYSYNQIIENINKYYYKFLIQNKENEILDIISSIPEENKGELKYQTYNSIIELLNRGRCLCGCDLIEGSDSYRTIQEELSKVQPNNFSKDINDFRHDVMNLSDDFEENFSNIIEAFKIYNTNLLNSEFTDDEIKNNREKLSSSTSEEIKKASIQLENYKDKKNELIENKGVIENRLKNNRSERERIDSQIIKLVPKSEKNKTINKYINYSEVLIKEVEQDYYNNKKEAILKLTESANKYFQEINSKNKIIKLNDALKAETYTIVNDEEHSLDDSGGENTNINIAYVLALVETGKKMLINNKSVLSDSKYPLLMDAPFSKSDTTHIKNICKCIYEIVDQPIILINEKDWNVAKDTIKSFDKIGKAYRIEIIDDNHSEFKTYDLEEL